MHYNLEGDNLHQMQNMDPTIKFSCTQPSFASVDGECHVPSGWKLCIIKVLGTLHSLLRITGKIYVHHVLQGKRVPREQQSSSLAVHLLAGLPIRLTVSHPSGSNFCSGRWIYEYFESWWSLSHPLEVEAGSLWSMQNAQAQSRGWSRSGASKLSLLSRAFKGILHKRSEVASTLLRFGDVCNVTMIVMILAMQSISFFSLHQ